MGWMRKLVGGALREASRMARDALQRQSDPEGDDSRVRSGARTGDVLPLWSRVGARQAEHWEVQTRKLEARWLSHESLVRASGGGEVLAGVWLAVGERIVDGWGHAGRQLFSSWESLPANADWMQIEPGLDGALQQVWRSFRPRWGEARARISETFGGTPTALEPGGLRERVDLAFQRGEALLSEAWLTSQGYLQSALREALDAPLPPDHGAGLAEALEAPWQQLTDRLEAAWDQALSGLEVALQARP